MREGSGIVEVTARSTGCEVRDDSGRAEGAVWECKGKDKAREKKRSSKEMERERSETFKGRSGRNAGLESFIHSEGSAGGRAVTVRLHDRKKGKRRQKPTLQRSRRGPCRLQRID